MVERLGNIYYPEKYQGKQHHKYTHGLIKFKNTYVDKNPKSPMRVVTINVSKIVLQFIKDELVGTGKLYASRSECIRHFIINGIQNVVDVMRALTHEVISNPIIQEDKEHFTDQYGTVWKIKPTEVIGNV